MSRYESYGTIDDRHQDQVDSNFKGFNNLVRPDSLEQGFFTDSKNFRFNVEGVAETRKGFYSFNKPFAIDTNTAFTLPFTLYANVTSNSASRSSTTITLGFASAHGISDDTLISVEDIAGLTNFIVGNYVANVTSTTALEITVSSNVSGTPSDSTIQIGAPILSDAQNTEIKSSCNFTDPADNGTEYVILASNAKAVALKVGTMAISDIAYPDGELVDNSSEMIEAFNKVYLFRDNRQTTLEWNGSFSGTPAFTKVESGSFSQPVLKSTTNDMSVANGTCTVVIANSSTDNPLSIGDEIVILVTANGFTKGETYTISAVSDTQFEFKAEVDDVGSSGENNGVAIDLIGRVSVESDFIHMPAPPFGIQHQDRLIVPFFNSVGASADTFTARNIDDEFLISYPFNVNKYDPPFGSFVSPKGGSNDRLVGFLSFTGIRLLVFNRKSIILVENIDTLNFTGTTTTLITDEVGLVARKSVVQVGNQILFLSDNGVYGASFIDLYNLRGNEIPLSKPIDQTMNSIDRTNWHKSCGVYYNNRYFLAVPIAPADGTDYSGNPNSIIVYNFLNKAWESVDTVDDVNFDITNLIVAGEGAYRGVYSVGSNGTLTSIYVEFYKNNELDSDIIYSGASQTAILKNIKSSLTTRQFNLNSIDRKKWNAFEIVSQGVGNYGSSVNVAAEFENTDKTVNNLATISIPAKEGISTRGRIGNHRAYGMQMTLSADLYRFQIRILKLTAGFTFKSIESTQ